MQTPQQELEINVNQIIRYLNSEKKIIPQQKEYLQKILSEMIELREISEETLKLLNALKQVEKAGYMNYVSVYARLLHNINMLGEWLHNNPQFKIPSSDLNRFKNILKRVNELDEFSDEEITVLIANSRVEEDEE